MVIACLALKILDKQKTHRRCGAFFRTLFFLFWYSGCQKPNRPLNGIPAVSPILSLAAVVVHPTEVSYVLLQLFQIFSRNPLRFSDKRRSFLPHRTGSHCRQLLAVFQTDYRLLCVQFSNIFFLFLHMH